MLVYLSLSIFPCVCVTFHQPACLSIWRHWLHGWINCLAFFVFNHVGVIKSSNGLQNAIMGIFCKMIMRMQFVQDIHGYVIQYKIIMWTTDLREEVIILQKTSLITAACYLSIWQKKFTCEQFWIWMRFLRQKGERKAMKQREMGLFCTLLIQQSCIVLC